MKVEALPYVERGGGWAGASCPAENVLEMNRDPK
eukprot:CAMPEP_0113287318 /NCGR_PEP_ID=MMETSP0008_2-20120614/31642_1 /TAXON_ID=97485 /ORGANISM="Prymnesium parvum" /LENGTH=33 /DNA_ID=CAMNT_0000138537 /DNA_START=167 /DNA_END=265 /DNA_ORIENTATION=- /assembly_acc=CAM_ASM_000153